MLSATFPLHAQSFDYGDAPDSYHTLRSNDGPRHAPFTSVYLGASTGYYDTEPDGQPGIMADGDDTHDQDGNVAYNQNDEDGLVNGFPAVSLSKSTYFLNIIVYNNSGADATVSAWIDFNKNGVFDANERTQAVVPTTPTVRHYSGTLVTLTWNGLNGLTGGWTYARLRVANQVNEVANPTGLANSGEVEDYRVQLKDEYDFGDAPKSYGTLKSDNGAQHLVNNNLILLGAVDCSAEDDGQPSDLADADAGETSVRFVQKLTTAKTSFSAEINVLNRSGADGMLSGWIDFNKNGTFEASERAQAVIGADTRNVVLSWSGLSGLTEGRTYARFRIACNADEVASPKGLASSGSVEDYTLMIEPPQYDYGDAPDNYGTLAASNGARHIYNDVEINLSLGDYIDAELDGQPTAQADGDDVRIFFTPVFDDEDGLLASPVLTTKTTSCTALLSVLNTTGKQATLSGWIDFNKNGTFETNERAQVVVPNSQSSSRFSVELIWTDLGNLTAGQTYMRFRIASNAAEVASPTGLASNGEVEDYTLTITPEPQVAQPVDLVSFQGQWLAGKGNQLTWVTSWEKDNDRFDIQRSADAKSFESIGWVAGKGNSSANQVYTYVDEQEAPLLYYRLKQVDFDGHVNYSRIISVRQQAESTLTMVVYPNPATEQIRVQLSTNQSVKSLRVYAVNGIQIISREDGSEAVDVRSLPAGDYILEITTTAGQVLRQHFVKQ